MIVFALLIIQNQKLPTFSMILKKRLFSKGKIHICNVSFFSKILVSPSDGIFVPRCYLYINMFKL